MSIFKLIEKKTKIFVFLFSIFFCGVINSQNKFSDLVNESRQSMQKSPDISYDDILRIKLGELISFGEAFVYFKELKDGAFEIVNNEKNYKLRFLGSPKYLKKRLQKSVTLTQSTSNEPVIIFEKTVRYVNGVDFKMLDLLNEELYVDYDSAFNNLKTFYNNKDIMGIPMIGYIWKSRLLIDKIICNFNPSHNYGNILSRSITTERLRTPENLPCNLFGDVTDGVALPYPLNGLIRTKIFSVDKDWDRVVWFDEDFYYDPTVRAFGDLGNGYEQFTTPTGITNSDLRVYDYGGGNIDRDYTLFVSDFNNNRIIKFVYRLKQLSFPSVHYVGYILSGSFGLVASVYAPYDIEFHTGNNPNEISDDILWFTVNKNGFTKELKCINTSSGTVLNNITSFIYESQSYLLSPSRISVYRSPSGGTNLLACVDDNLHSLLFFKLNPNGTLSTNEPLCTSAWRFNVWDKLTSVKMISNNPSLGVDAIVTYNNEQNDGCINLFRVHTVNGWPIADYLASNFSGYGSSSGFKHLNNLASQNSYLDISTIESWDNNYGIRRYKPGFDILSENAGKYCTDLGYMTLQLRITNPCHLDFAAWYCNGYGCTWEPRDIESINGVLYNGTEMYLPSGTNTLRIKINNINDDILGGEKKIKLRVNMAPQDEELYSGNPHQIMKVYEVYVGICNTGGGGGCPYLYVFDGDSLKQDNNILHKSEFPENAGVDITDIYKLRVNPKFDEINNTCTLQIRELNNDYSYFDKFQLKAVDHPLGTLLGVTENKDLVLYFPNAIVSPDSAFWNDSDVTCDLQYDTSCANLVLGDSSDFITTINEGDGLVARLFTKFGNVLKNVLKSIGIREKDNINPINVLSKRSDYNIDDSIAVIMDPQEDSFYPPINVQKDYAGQLIGCSVESDFCSEPKLFARRENRSDVIVPVGKDVLIDSVYTDWYRSFEISYLCTTPVYYGGYSDIDLELVGAIHTTNGDVLETLREKDNNYVEMENENRITLSFNNTLEPVQEGWTRDYILITDGRYVRSEGDRLILKNSVNNSLPRVFRLHQNYPNPFNPLSKIKYDLPKDIQTTIKIYDILGREVRILINEFKKAGYYEAVFDGTNLASGVYFYRIEAGTFVDSKKMVLVK